MKRVIQYSLRAAFITATCAVGTARAGDSVGAGYDLIPKANVFRLKEPPPVVQDPGPRTELPKIYLAGVSSVGQRKLAFLKLAGHGGKGGAQAAEETFALGVGERQGGIEVLDIDAAAGRVKIRQGEEVL